MSEIIGACLSQFHDDENRFELLVAFSDGREVGHVVSRIAAKRIAADFAREFDETPSPQPLLVGIKPLVWEQHGWVEAFSQPAGFGFWYSAIPEKPVRGPGDPPFKLNVIWGVPGNSERHCLGSNFASIEDAKAAAQSDYERRVRAAFAVLSAPEAEG